MGGQGSSEQLIDILVQIIALSESRALFLTDPIYLEVAVATTATITVYIVENPSKGRDDYLAEIPLLVWLVGVGTSVVQWLGRHSLGL